jgi:hypothetical protein
MSYDDALLQAIPNPVLRWKLDEGPAATMALNTGSAGANGHMVATNSTMSAQPPLINTGSSYRFTDSGTVTSLSSTVAGAAINGLSSLSVVLWFKYDQTPGNDFLIDSTNASVQLGLSIRKATTPQNGIAVNVHTSTGSCSAWTQAGILAPGTTYNVILTWRQGNPVKVYINGVPVALTIVSGTLNAGDATAVTANTTTTPNTLYLGRWKSQVDTNLGGWMDDVTVGEAYITDAQAAAIYAEGLTWLPKAIII